MKATAYAKLNLALAVYPASADGYHPVRGIFQSISLADTVSITTASEDTITVSNDEAPADESNLAWIALATARRSARVGQPMSLHIDKRIPSGAGLGGGSADAAAALGMMARAYRIDEDRTAEIAESLGSDVPFAFTGGSMIAEGRGERLTPIEPHGGFAVAVVVPPFGLETPTVFREWDRLDGPEGKELDERSLPPSLRGGLPIRNDLFPAAVSLDPRLADWRADLMRRWGTDVAMTGSGSALFGFFASLTEAGDAAAAVDLPTRLATAATPVPRGWEPIDG